MTENMKKFLEQVSADKALMEQVVTLDKEALIALAKEWGLELTEADFVAPEGEIAADALETVAGGYQRCVCLFGGGGKKDEDGAACGCVAAGAGISNHDGEARCICAAAGTGYESLREI